MPTIEAAICTACKELNVELNENPGCKPNIAAAARRHSVNYTTLRNRFQGHTRAKKQKKKETAQRREDKAAERRRQRENRNLSEPFRGSLTSKNKGDLQEIAGVLGLSEDGTVKDLRTRIIAHFDANSHLRDSP